MKTYKNLYLQLCSYDNLFIAYKKARKRKTKKDYVIEFERNLEHNLLLLRSELLLHCYKPKHLVNFIIRDPKTRRISKSDFRDRVVHHALCNIIEPIFEKSFIYDSFANRVGKGTLKAAQRFDFFKRKASKNNTAKCYILKADIQKYFENVDHEIYDFIEGWIAYAKSADTYKLRKKITEEFERAFPDGISTKEINRYLKALEK